MKIPVERAVFVSKIIFFAYTMSEIVVFTIDKKTVIN